MTNLPIRHERLVRLAAGDEVFRYPRAAHQTPFVVVSGQPQFGDVFEFLLRGDLTLLQVRVVIDDRHPLRMLVIKLLRPRSREKEVAMQKIGSGHGAEFED